jgi:hypothetical protein
LRSVSGEHARRREVTYGGKEKSVIAICIAAGEDVALIADFEHIAFQGVMVRNIEESLGRYTIGPSIPLLLDRCPHNAAIHSAKAETHPGPV